MPPLFPEKNLFSSETLRFRVGSQLPREDWLLCGLSSRAKRNGEYDGDRREKDALRLLEREKDPRESLGDRLRLERLADP